MLLSITWHETTYCHYKMDSALCANKGWSKKQWCPAVRIYQKIYVSYCFPMTTGYFLSETHGIVSTISVPPWTKCNSYSCFTPVRHMRLVLAWLPIQYHNQNRDKGMTEFVTKWWPHILTYPTWSCRLLAAVHLHSVHLMHTGEH